MNVRTQCSLASQLSPISLKQQLLKSRGNGGYVPPHRNPVPEDASACLISQAGLLSPSVL